MSKNIQSIQNIHVWRLFLKTFNLTSFRNLPLIRQPCLYSRNAEQLSDFRCRSIRVTQECSLSETGQYGSY